MYNNVHTLNVPFIKRIPMKELLPQFKDLLVYKRKKAENSKFRLYNVHILNSSWKNFSH